MPTKWATRRTMTNLAVVLHRWRINDGRTIRQAAFQVGISAATWMRLEHGYGMDGTTLVKLLAWFMRPQFPAARRAAQGKPVVVSWEGINLPSRKKVSRG